MLSFLTTENISFPTGHKMRGFSLIEVLIYIAIVAVLITVVSGTFLWLVKNQTKANAIQETTDNAAFLMAVISREIRSAQQVYLATTVLNNDLGQLSLKTMQSAPSGETVTYIDFYLCGHQLCLKREGAGPIILSSDKVEIEQLKFNRIVTGQRESLEAILALSFVNPKNRPEKEVSLTLNSVTSLGGY
jgi:prepilin-type N-terminal cleavage/methylation domain-containing protein